MLGALASSATCSSRARARCSPSTVVVVSIGVEALQRGFVGQHDRQRNQPTEQSGRPKTSQLNMSPTASTGRRPRVRERIYKKEGLIELLHWPAARAGRAWCIVADPTALARLFDDPRVLPSDSADKSAHRVQAYVCAPDLPALVDDHGRLRLIRTYGRLRPSGRLYLQGVGELKVKWHRPWPREAEIKTVSANAKLAAGTCALVSGRPSPSRCRHPRKQWVSTLG